MKLCSYIILLAILAAIQFPKPVSSQNYVDASYMGTKQDLKEFMCGELIYPESSMASKSQGSVCLVFIIKQDGAVQNIEIKKSVDPEIDKEAIRLLKKMLWLPATQYGKPVASRHEVDIPFNIKRYKKQCKKRGYDRPLPADYPVDESFHIYPLEQLTERPSPLFKKKNYSIGKLIVEEMKYPEAAFKQNISGKVKLYFVVEPNGKPSHFFIDKSVGGGCDQEAIRIAKMINWKPGVKNEMIVRSRMILEITFELPSDADMDYFYNNQNTSF